MRTNLLSISFARVAPAFFLALAGSILSPAAQAQVTNWNAARDFYFDSTNYVQRGGSWAGANAPSAAGQAWGYYAVNANWHVEYPKEIGVYFPPGADQNKNQSLIPLATYQPLGAGQGKLASDDAFEAIGGAGLAVYALNPSVGVGRPFVGYYSQAWGDPSTWTASPGYGTPYENLGGLILQSSWLNGTEASGGEGICTLVTWKAPSAGTYDFTGSFLVANNNGPNPVNGAQTSLAIVDSQGGTPLPRTVVLQGTYNPFTFRKILNQGDVVQFQVGTAYQLGAMVGLNVDVNLVPGSITSWNALRDFYFDSTNYAQNGGSWAGATNPLATAGGSAWGYYAANCNKDGEFPSQIGTYFPSGNNTAANQVLYALANYQPLGAGQAQIAGGVDGSGDAYDPTGGFGFARYEDKFDWKVSLGAFAKPWFDGAPGFSTDAKGGIWMQAGLSNQSDREGICPVVTWTAPVSGIYDFKGSFQIGNNGSGAGASIAIVDSRGGAPLPRLSAVMGMDYPFSFRRVLSQGDVVQIQVGSDYKIGAAVGLNADVTLVQEVLNNAYRDFYLSPTASGWTGATNPSGAKTNWGYYAANVNGYEFFPTNIGSYFTPDLSGSGSQSLYKYSSASPLGSATPVGVSGFTAAGGANFAYYSDIYGWTSSLGRFESSSGWFDGAPGYSQGLSNLIWMKAGLGGQADRPGIEGIAPVLAWKAPSSGSYTFTGRWVAGNQSGKGASVAIVDSLNGTPQSRTSLAPNEVNSFSFTKSYSAGDVVQFQVGSDFKTANAVGLDLNVNQRIDSLINLTGSTALAFSGSGVTPSLTVLGSSNSPTYSYVGVDGTTYGPSSNAPTARGRYRVTATTASEDAWSSSIHNFEYSVGTFNAFKDFWWNRAPGLADWTDPVQALAQGRSQATPTTMNGWSYGSINCTAANITDANVNRNFQSLGGSSYSDAGPSWSYNSGDGSRSGTQVSWSASNRANGYLALTPSAGAGSADGLAPALRWTAPADGKYRFKGEFRSQSGAMNVAIQTLGNPDLDDNATFLDRTTVAAGASQAFDTVQDVVAGQTVTWVVGSDGASDGDVMLLSANVDQVTPLTISGVVVANKDYDGSTSATLSGTSTLVGVLPGHDVSLTNLAVAFNSANAGIQGVTVTAGLTGADAAIYTLSMPTDVTGLISKATPTIFSAPTATAITQGQTLASSILSGGTASVGGTFAWTTDSTAPGSSGSYPVTFTPTDGANYNTATTSVSVTVNSAAPTGASFTSWRGSSPASAALLQNYAFGAASPSSTLSQSSLPSSAVVSEKLVLTYYVRQEATNPNLVVPQLSTDLASPGNWADLGSSSIATISTDNVDGVQVVKKTASVPVDSTPRKFLRLKIQE